MKTAMALFKEVRRDLPDRFLVARSVKGFFPLAGDQATWLMAYLDYPKECHRLLEKSCKNEIMRAEEFISHGADAIFVGGRLL